MSEEQTEGYEVYEEHPRPVLINALVDLHFFMQVSSSIYAVDKYGTMRLMANAVNPIIAERLVVDLGNHYRVPARRTDADEIVGVTIPDFAAPDDEHEHDDWQIHKFTQGGQEIRFRICQECEARQNLDRGRWRNIPTEEES